MKGFALLNPGFSKGVSGACSQNEQSHFIEELSAHWQKK